MCYNPIKAEKHGRLIFSEAKLVGKIIRKVQFSKRSNKLDSRIIIIAVEYDNR